MRYLIAVIGLIGAFLIVQQLTVIPLDLTEEWISAQAAMDGVPLYQPSENYAPAYGFGGTEEIYPRTPGALLLSMVLAPVPRSALPLTGYLFVLVGLGATAVLLARFFDLAWWWLLGLLPLFMLTAVGTGTGLMANPAVAVAPLILLSLLAGRRGDSYRGGVPLGVATVLKLWPWAIPAVLFLTGRRRMALGAGLSFMLLNLAGLWLPGVSIRGAVEAMSGQTWRFSYGDNGALTALIGSTVLVQLLLVGVVVWLSRFDWETAAIAVIPFALFLAPLLWAYYLVPELIALVWAWRKGSLVPLWAVPVSLLWPVISAGTITILLALISIAATVHGLYLRQASGEDVRPNYLLLVRRSGP